jgi:hypothetical protein
MSKKRLMNVNTYNFMLVLLMLVLLMLRYNDIAEKLIKVGVLAVVVEAM